jgi:hypothetical protein
MCIKKRKLKETIPISWRTVSRQAPSIEKKCSTQIRIFLGLDNHFYLAKTSCLHRSHHPGLKSEAISHGNNNMDKCDIDLLTLLSSVNVQPFQIPQIMCQMKGPQAGTFSPKCLYNTNKRTEELQNFVLGLIADCNDAEKTIAKLEL